MHRLRYRATFSSHCPQRMSFQLERFHFNHKTVAGSLAVGHRGTALIFNRADLTFLKKKNVSVVLDQIQQSDEQ